jgi:SAM-dependent methyltransferase
MSRGYQRSFSDGNPAMFDETLRTRKALTMIAVLEDFLDQPLSGMSLLNVGSSAGYVDDCLAGRLGRVTGIDLDTDAVIHAGRTFDRENLAFVAGDAMDLPFPEGSFGLAVCSHVYEHVPDARRLFSEIFRVLEEGGVCYFSGSNRLRLMEPHYRLPFLSLLPRFLAHPYVRVAGRGERYYEKHLTWWGLRSLVERFEVVDYTLETVSAPEKYGTDYMLRPGSVKAAAARLVARSLPWLSPGCIWLLV